MSGATKYSFILIIKLSYHGKGDAQTKNEQWRNLLMDCIPFMQTWLCSLCWRDPFTYKVKQLVFLLMVPDGRQISPWIQEVNLKVHKTFRRRFRRLLNVNCTFNLHPVSRREICIRTQFTWLTFHDGGRYNIETSPLICSSNQWTGFYMITASVMKGLNDT